MIYSEDIVPSKKIALEDSLVSFNEWNLNNMKILTIKLMNQNLVKSKSTIYSWLELKYK